MGPTPGCADPPAALSASDLAEYTYCPRAFYYRHHPPTGGVEAEVRRERRYGKSYHVRESRSMRSRETHGWVWELVVVVSAVGLAALLGGLLLGWI